MISGGRERSERWTEKWTGSILKKIGEGSQIKSWIAGLITLINPNLLPHQWCMGYIKVEHDVGRSIHQWYDWALIEGLTAVTGRSTRSYPDLQELALAMNATWPSVANYLDISLTYDTSIEPIGASLCLLSDHQRWMTSTIPVEVMYREHSLVAAFLPLTWSTCELNTQSSWIAPTTTRILDI